MNTEKEIKKLYAKLDAHEKRIKDLEGYEPIKSKQSKEKSSTEMFELLKREAFFKEKRTANQILDKLLQKGYTYKRAASLTGPLLRATKNGLLQREKTDEDWVYFAE